MQRPSTRPWILALALAACTGGSGSAPLAVESISVPDFGRWEVNRPIEFAFEQPVDFGSVSAQSIQIRTSSGVPAAGAFAAKAIDADGNGVPEGTDEKVVVFFPSCPRADDLSDAGLTPGARYVVTLAGADSGQDPATLLRSRSGSPLAHTVVRAFEAIADPASALFDEKPGAPVPLVRAAGASAGPGCHLELGGDPSRRVFFEGDPTSGRTPGGFAAPLNLLGDPATHVAAVVVFDQPIRPAPANLARLSLEYNATLDASGWIPLETRAELVSDCRPADPTVRLVPLGTFPPGGFVRVRIEAGFEDAAGQATSAPFEEFALTEVATVGFTSLDPAGAIADELREEFDFGSGSLLSFQDPVRPVDAAPAQWGQGELRGGVDIPGIPPELREFDWVVPAFRTFEFDTTATDIEGGPDGLPVTIQSSRDGFVAVRDLVVEQGARILVRGPNPLVVHASGRVTIRGAIDASGVDADIESAFLASPSEGGAGGGGGGAGGTGGPGMDTRGGSGQGALGAGVGGQGGESGFAAEGVMRRGGGGGGGRFASDRGAMLAENGGDGADTSSGAESGLSPARGGTAGPEVFVDGDPSNDFFGVQPVVDSSGAVVGRRAGELDHVHAGAGGGNGGDSIVADSFPLPSNPAIVTEGAGGGGGGGALVIRALGRIVFGGRGVIRVNGGRGGVRSGNPRAFGGASGGSGSGGHVILESADAIDFTGGNPFNEARSRVEAIGGPRSLQPPSPQGYGGAGGPGVVQLHVPHPERAPSDPASNLILPGDALVESNPLAVVCKPTPYVLYPTIGSRSTAQSRWVPLGAAGEGSANGPESVVAFLFDGIETAPGADQGKVRTSGGRVVELPPLLGPVHLTEPGVELLADGISLALSGAALAPLRASAQPISKDVYLRTPALLEGFTVRLAHAGDPGRRGDFTIARARYDDAASELELTLGGLLGTLADAAAELGGPEVVELSLLPRFFRVRQGSGGADVLPDSRTVRILFQGAADDGTGRPDELHPLVDWTGDVAELGALAPGTLDFLRFRVEFELDADGNGLGPEAEPTALEFLRLPYRF